MNRAVFFLLASLIAITVVGSALTAEAINEKERSLKDDLMSHSELAALSVNVTQVQGLSGSLADIGSADYTALKALLVEDRDVISHARFVYIVGQWSNGTIFIYVDSEPATSPDYSPPGQTYGEASSAFGLAFKGNTSMSGPVADRWGTWMTTLVPLRDPTSGEVVAVLGTDMDASDWGWQTAMAGAPEALASLLLALLLIIFFIMRRRKDREEQQLIRSAELMRESEKKHRLLIENSHDIIYTITREGTFTFVSPSWTTLLGHPVDQVVGRPFQSFVHADDLTRCMTALQRSMEMKQRQTGVEYRVRHADGSWRWHSSNAIPLFDEAGMAVGIEGVSSDITVQKDAEDDLQKSEKRYHMLVDSANEAIVVAEGEMLRFANPAAVKLTGFSEQELTSKPFTAIIHPEDLAMVMDRYQRRARGESIPNRYTFRVLTRDGSSKMVEMNTVAIDWEGRPASLNFYTDITERMRDEATLRDSEEKIRLLMNSAAEAIYGLDMKGNCTFCNDSCLRLLGYNHVEELLGKNMHWKIHAKHSDGSPYPVEECHIFQAFNKGEGTHVDDEVLWRSDGTSFPAEYWSYPQFHDGVIIGAVVSFLDITERKRIEGELKRQSEMLLTLNEIISMANKADDLPQLLESIMEESLRLLDFDAGGIYIVDLPTRTANVVCSKNLPPEFLADIQTLSIDMKPYDALFLKNEPIITENYELIDPDRSRIFGLQSMASIPLLSKGITIGALNIASTRRQVISEEDRQMLSSISREIGSTIERMMAEDEARKVSTNLETLFNSIDEMIFVLDMQGNIIAVNGVVLNRLQYALGELKGMNVLLLHVPERRDEALQNVQGMITGTIDSCLVPVQAKDGTRIEVETKVTRGWWNGKEVLIGVTRDITERKHAEEALHLISSRLAMATQAGGVGIWDFDIVKNELTWDDQMFRLYGIQREQFSGVYEAWRAGLLPEDEQRGDAEIQMALRGEKEFDTEFRVRWPDGTIRNIRARAQVQRDASGKPLRMIGTNWDITVQKQIEEALKESTDRFKQLAEIFPETIFEADLKGNITYANDHGLVLFELDASDIAKGVNIFNLIAPSDRQRVLSRVSERLDGRKGDYIEYRAMRKNGGTFDALAYSVTILKNGLPFGIRGFILDISNRKQMEDALRQSEESLRLVVTSAPFPLLITDRDGTYIIDANKQAVTAFGLEMEKGHMLAEIFYNELELAKVMETIDHQGFVDDVEVSVRTQGGERRWALISARPMSFQGEERLLMASYDITDRRRMERVLQQANAKLGIMNSITRHDIINQMTALNGFLELCKMREKDPNLISYFDRMSRAAGNVQRQIAFTKDYQDMGVNAPAWASVGRQTAEAFAMLHPKGVELEDATNGVEVMADQLAEKVPYNLIDNSMRHGEHVTKIKMSAEQVGDAMMIVYEDDGEGISAMDKAHLFEKGFGKNTGLGLFFIREILAITDITIEEKGRPGKGVRFEMLVPPGNWRRTSQ